MSQSMACTLLRYSFLLAQIQPHADFQAGTNKTSHMTEWSFPVFHTFWMEILQMLLAWVVYYAIMVNRTLSKRIIDSEIFLKISECLWDQDTQVVLSTSHWLAWSLYELLFKDRIFHFGNTSENSSVALSDTLRKLLYVWGEHLLASLCGSNRPACLLGSPVWYRGIHVIHGLTSMVSLWRQFFTRKLIREPDLNLPPGTGPIWGLVILSHVVYIRHLSQVYFQHLQRRRISIKSAWGSHELDFMMHIIICKTLYNCELL